MLSTGRPLLLAEPAETPAAVKVPSGLARCGWWAQAPHAHYERYVFISFIKTSYVQPRAACYTLHSRALPHPHHSPFSGLKKLKNESLGTCLVIVLTVPRPLCFCFFLIVLTVTFFPFFQSIVHLGTSQPSRTRTSREKRITNAHSKQTRALPGARTDLGVC